MVRFDKLIDLKRYRGIPLLVLLVLFGLCKSSLIGQRDTVLLDEVIIEGINPSLYLPGGAQRNINTDSTRLQSLGYALKTQAPIYLVEYGTRGQLASINLRGLGSSRTALLWQGMEINSFTLGQADFNQITASSGYQMTLQLGSVGALFGNGALGGAITLDHFPVFNQGITLNTSQGVGSFGYFTSQIGLSYSSAKIHSSTAFNFRKARNNFSYYNGNQRLRQKNARFDNSSFTQDLYYRINDTQSLSWHLWYNDFYREIQPHREDLQNTDELDNSNLRTTLQWTVTKPQITTKTSLGFSRDDQVYNNEDQVALNRWFAAFDMEWTKAYNILIKASAKINHLVAQVDAYDGGIQETRATLSGSLLWDVNPRFKVGINISAPTLDDKIEALSPLLSAQYVLIRGPHSELSLDGQLSKAYRLPTLNDRYWNPGGNVDLKAESSVNWEFGASFTTKKESLAYEGSLRYFNHHVDNWIIWIPGGRETNDQGNVITFWFPDNIRKVSAQGVESFNSLKFRFADKRWNTSLTAHGSFNRSVNKQVLSALDRSLNKQLPYTPKWLLNAQWSWVFDTWSWGIQANYRGQRFVETNNELPALPGFTLYRMVVSKYGKLKPINWRAEIAVNNLFNLDYENFENRAMPGRNFSLNINLSYNK